MRRWLTHPLGLALLALLALLGGGLLAGWRGVVLVLTGLVFLLLRQFHRLMRVMQQAGRAPVGQVPSALQVHSQLQAGMALVDVLACAGSLGEAVPGQAHTYRWCDAGGDALVLRFDANSRLADWTLTRAS